MCGGQAQEGRGGLGSTLGLHICWDCEGRRSGSTLGPWPGLLSFWRCWAGAGTRADPSLMGDWGGWEGGQAAPV